MPADHSKHGFLKDIGTDWVALGPTGAPLARAATEDGVRRAVPDAAEYVTGKKIAVKAEKVEILYPDLEDPALPPDDGKGTEPVAIEPAPTTGTFDHDGDGKPGGSKKGAEATASKSRRQRKPVA